MSSEFVLKNGKIEETIIIRNNLTQQLVIIRHDLTKRNETSAPNKCLTKS